MTPLTRLLLALVALGAGPLLVPACGGDEDDDHHDSGGAIAEAEALLADLQGQDYRSFDRIRGWDAPHAEASTPHHGDFIDIYVNSTLQAAIDGAGPPFPEGSIVIKDGWSDAAGTDLVQTAVMRKDAAGWFWAEFGADGHATEAGTEVDECLECHATGTDHLLSL